MITILNELEFLICWTWVSNLLNLSFLLLNLNFLNYALSILTWTYALLILSLSWNCTLLIFELLIFAPNLEFALLSLLRLRYWRRLEYWVCIEIWLALAKSLDAKLRGLSQALRLNLTAEITNFDMLLFLTLSLVWSVDECRGNAAMAWSDGRAWADHVWRAGRWRCRRVEPWPRMRSLWRPTGARYAALRSSRNLSHRCLDRIQIYWLSHTFQLLLE